MKIFISWSTPKAKRVADALREWLKDLMHMLEPFASSRDIAKGDRGFYVISRELQDSSQGVICLTQDNQTSAWLNFEAGAISKQIDESRVYPVLIDLQGSDLRGPLKEFQYSELFSKESMRDMVTSIWSRCPEKCIDIVRLHRTFDRLWDDFIRPLQDLKQVTPELPPEEEEIDIQRKINELINIARQNQRRIRMLEGDLGGDEPLAEGPGIATRRRAVEGAKEIRRIMKRFAKTEPMASVQVGRRGVVEVYFDDLPSRDFEEILMEIGTACGTTVEIRKPLRE